MAKETLIYFNIKGRGEPIRMTFAACGAAFAEEAVDYGAMKAEAGTAASPFGQAPMLAVEGSKLTQMQAVMRYVAATYKPALLGGDSPLAKANVDMLLAAIDDLYLKYISCVYQEKLSEEGKAALWAKHFASDSLAASNGGAHVAYIVNCLSRSGGPFLAGAQFSIADVFFYFALEAFSREQCFGAKVTDSYPALTGYMAAVAATEGLKDRLADPARAAPRG